MAEVLVRVFEGEGFSGSLVFEECRHTLTMGDVAVEPLIGLVGRTNFGSTHIVVARTLAQLGTHRSRQGLEISLDKIRSRLAKLTKGVDSYYADWEAAREEVARLMSVFGTPAVGISSGSPPMATTTSPWRKPDLTSGPPPLIARTAGEAWRDLVGRSWGLPGA